MTVTIAWKPRKGDGVDLTTCHTRCSIQIEKVSAITSVNNYLFNDAYSVIVSHDQAIKNYLEGIKPIKGNKREQWGVVIAYSSVGVNFPAKKLNNDKLYGFGIHRNVSEKSQPSNEDWEELLKWAGSIVDQSQTEEKEIDTIVSEMPLVVQKLLCPPTLPYITALSVMCQGYIAAHGGTLDEQRSLEGWEELDTYVKYSAKKKKKKTESTEWWECVVGEEGHAELEHELESLNMSEPTCPKEFMSHVRSIKEKDFFNVANTLTNCGKILKDYGN